MKNYKKLLFFVIYLLLLGISTAQPQTSKCFVYVSLRNSNAIATYELNQKSGEITLTDSLGVQGGPASMGTDPLNNILYVTQRSANTLSAFKINHKDGKLIFLNTVPAVDNPVYVATDQKRNFLFTAYYAAGKAAVYKLNPDGSIVNDPIQVFEGFVNAHSILIDPSNKFAFVADKGGDKIYQYLFNENNGKLIPNDPAAVITPKGTEPRHFVFNREKNIVYFVNETNNTVTAYHFNVLNGTLTQFQNLSTLPENFKGQSKTADIHLTPDDKFLYASNRGYNSIAAYSVDSKTGQLKLVGIFESVKNPRSFAIDPSGKFLIAAGESSNDLVIYKIDQGSGALQLINKIRVGEMPSWVMILQF